MPDPSSADRLHAQVWRWLTETRDPFFGWPLLSWLCWAVCLGIVIGVATGLYDVGHGHA